MATNVTDLINKAAGAFILPPPSEAPAEKLASESNIVGRYGLNPDEESLVIEIVQFYKFNATPLTLHELLCFDLHEQMTHLSSYVSPTDYQKIESTFKKIWLSLIGHSKAGEQFPSFLRELPTTFLKAHSDHLKNQPAEGLQVRGDGERKQILDSLTSRVRLLMRLLSQDSLLPELFKTPLYPEFKEIQIYSNMPDNATSFKNLGKFLVFAFQSFAALDASFGVYLAQAQELHLHMSGLIQLGKKIDKIAFEPFYALVKQLSTDKRTVYLQSIVLKTHDTVVSYFVKYKAFISKLVTPQHITSILTGKESSFKDSSIRDKLARFRTENLLPSSFQLTPDEEKILDQVFEENPLDSELTLLDLLSFSLNERLKNLQGELQPNVHDALKNIRLEVGAYAYLLYFGFMRSNLTTCQMLGPCNKESERYHAFPEQFIRHLQGQIHKLRTLIPPTNLKKHAHLSEKAQKKLNDKVAELISPIVDLWIKLLTSPHNIDLLLKGAGYYGGSDALDRDNPLGKAVFSRYFQFHKEVYDYGRKKGYFGTGYTFQKLYSISSTPTHQEAEAFTQNLVKEVFEITSFRKEGSKELFEFVQNRLPPEALLMRSHSIQTKKSPAQLKEMLHQNLSVANLLYQIFQDILRIAEKRIFPKGTLPTESSFVRLAQNNLILSKGLKTGQQDPTIVWNLIDPEIENAFKPLQHYLDSPAFRVIREFISQNEFVLKNSFNLEDWIPLLSPHGETLETVFKTSLKNLSAVPSELQLALHQYFSSLSLEELQAVKVDEIKDLFFHAGLKFLIPMQIVMDQLAILQKIRFYDEAAIIPPELADIMLLDGIDTLLEEAIQAKTPKPVPLSVTIPQPESPPAAVESKEEVAPPPPKVAKQKKQKAKPVTVVVSKPLPPPPIDPLRREITNLTKSRLILVKLIEMKFYPVRQTGSHVILKHPDAPNTVIVPTHPELPFGTRQSIADQASLKNQ